MTDYNESRRKELADFLKTRRQRLSPQDVGLPPDTQRRRTPGLRREEVAVLAGISLPWYVSLEQGRDIRVSDQVLISLARTLRLDASERRHLFLLANPKTCLADAPPPAFPTIHVEPALIQHLEQLEPCPAYVFDRRWNILAWNRMAARLFGDYAEMAEDERNAIWLMFTRREYRERFTDWEDLAQNLVAQFRLSFGYHMHDPWYQGMVDRLSEASPEFREWWSRHEVQCHPERPKSYHHPVAGLLQLETNVFSLLRDERPLFLKAMMPVAGTDTMEKLKELSRRPSDQPLPV